MAETTKKAATAKKVETKDEVKEKKANAPVGVFESVVAAINKAQSRT